MKPQTIAHHFDALADGDGPPEWSATVAKAAAMAALHDWVARVGGTAATRHLTPRFGMERARLLVQQLGGSGAPGETSGRLAKSWARYVAKSVSAGLTCPHCKQKATKGKVIGEPVGYCDRCDRNFSIEKSHVSQDLLARGAPLVLQRSVSG